MAIITACVVCITFFFFNWTAHGEKYNTRIQEKASGREHKFKNCVLLLVTEDHLNRAFRVKGKRIEGDILEI